MPTCLASADVYVCCSVSVFAVLATYNLSSMFTLSGLVVSMASVVMVLL